MLSNTLMGPFAKMCGCVRGFFLCREAETLWAEVIKKMRRYDDYSSELATYEKHFEGKPNISPEKPSPSLPRAAPQQRITKSRISASALSAILADDGDE